MRFIGRALLASAVVLGACGGGDKAATTDSSAAMATPAATTTPAATPATATPSTGAAPAGAMKPITGKTVEVKMVGDAQGYRFEPANLTIKAGDGVKFTVVSMPPHNVAFDATTPDPAKTQLMANMPNQMQPLSSPFLTNPGESYTISFAGVAPGTYSYNCTPHLAMGMKGTITVQ